MDSGFRPHMCRRRWDLRAARLGSERIESVRRYAFAVDDVLQQRLGLSPEQVAAFCDKWGIARLELFGSVLREDFDDASDVDVLVTFRPGVRWKFRDDLAMEEEFTSLVGRPAELIERRLIESSANWVRRRRILESARVVYAAA